MPKTWKLVALGFAAFFVFLVANFPADLAVRWFAPQLPELSTGIVEGSIWSGRARNAGFQKFTATEIRWTLHPFALFTGALEADLTVKLPHGGIDASVHQTTSGSTEFENLRGSLRLADAAALGFIPRNIAEGEILLNIEKLQLINGHPAAANGRIGLTGLESALLRGVSLGSYQADIVTKEEAIEATFADVEAPMRVQGSFVLQNNGRYTVDAKLLPVEGAPKEIENSLKFLGQADASGRYSFRSSGQL